MKYPKQLVLNGLLSVGLICSARAGIFFSDFNTGGLPSGSHTNSNFPGGSGGAYLETSGGIGDSGCLKICKAINSQNGSFILDDLDGGTPIAGFDLTCKIRVGGGTATPADGFAIVVAPDISDTSIWGETGTGSGLRFTWGIYTGSGQTPPDPAIRIRIGGAGNIVAYKPYTIASMSTTGTDPSAWWTDLHIRLNADGSLNMDYKGAVVFTNYFIPGYQDLINAGVPVRFGIAGRTGGLNDNFWFDNLQITTFTTPLVGISQQPLSKKVVTGDNAFFDVRVGNVNGVSYQWRSNGIPIPGATDQTLVISNVTAAASGSAITVVATGPNNSVTSSVATLTVVNLTLPPTPQLTYNFNDGTVPLGTSAFGTASPDTTGDATNGGTMKLTTAVNDASGAFMVFDPSAGVPVYGFTARFQMLVGGGTTPPADGFAFAYGTNIPADPTVGAPQFEAGQGLGTGLIVTFDIFNNDGIFGYSPNEGAQPAPSIDVRFGGNVIASVQLPLSFMESGADYGDTLVQMNTDGTLNVVYRGVLVFDHLFIPGFGSFSGGNFVWAGRTGGLSENIWLDNIELTTSTTSGNVRITTQPTAQTVLVNHFATFTAAVSDTNGVAFQWFRNGSPISGATSATYTIPNTVLGDNGALFKMQASRGADVTTSSEVALTVVNLTAPPTPVVTYDFNNGLVPAGTTIYGGGTPPGGYVAPTGGVGNSGDLHLTDNTNGMSGAFIVQPLLGGAQVNAIWVAFDVLLGGGTIPPADGFSFNWAANLTEGVVGGAEDGTGGNLTIGFDIFDNGNETPPAPSIDVRYKGTVVASTRLTNAQLDTGGGFVTVYLRVDSTGKLDLSFGERVLYSGLQLPNYTFVANGKYGFYARTGGLNANQWIDNILLQPTQSTGPMTIVQQPVSAAVIVGQTATFTSAASAPVGATYQWQKNGSPISGATTTSYTTPATVLGDNGSGFRMIATGPSGSATSSVATLTVVAPITLTSPSVIYDFNDCSQPSGTFLNGNGQGLGNGGYVDCSGGVTNSGVLKLTDAINGEGGTFIFPDFADGQPVKAFTLYFAARVGGGTAPPADGFAMVWCSTNDLPSNTIFGEGGFGGGLTVSFDIYINNNDTPEAPSFTINYHGVEIAKKLVPLSDIETGTGYADCYIRVSETGKLDLQYKGNAVFAQLQLPGYTPIAGGEFALGARTGGLNENQWFDNIGLARTIIPVLGWDTSGGGLTLTWGSGYKLQSTPSLTPPVTWTDVPGATSPYTPPLTAPAQFYRLAPTP